MIIFLSASFFDYCLHQFTPLWAYGKRDKQNLAKVVKSSANGWRKLITVIKSYYNKIILVLLLTLLIQESVLTLKPLIASSLNVLTA